MVVSILYKIGENLKRILQSLKVICDGVQSSTTIFYFQITEEVLDVFVEITSPLSLPDCKYVMESLLKHMVSNEFNSKTESGETHNGLLIEPLRVADEEGDLRCLYPSKVDLQINDVLVERVENKTKNENIC